MSPFDFFEGLIFCLKKQPVYGNTKAVMNNIYLNLNEKCKTLPNSPGVYLMQNSQGEIIYVGKAKNLKNRVSSYFLSEHEKGSKVEKMVENVKDFEYIITDSEFEALVLECSLIKKHRPKYNILLKDSKGYSYIKISNEAWPKISSVKQKSDDNAVYIGPYMSSFSVKKTVEEISKIFKLPNCSRDLGKKWKRPCLNYYINRCSAPCIRAVSHEEYLAVIAEVRNFLKNGMSKTEAELKKQMSQAAENMQFEKAAKIRDKIAAIEKIKGKQKVVSYGEKEQDVIAVSGVGSDVSVQIFRFKSGDMHESENFLLSTSQPDDEIRAEFLKQFYETEDFIPKTIILDGRMEDFELIEKLLSKKAKKKVKIEIPQKGKAYELVKMCKNNAYENLLRSSGVKTKEDFYIQDLKNLLGLEKSPKRIEAYDISNLFGTNCVAGMVVFQDGKRLKKDYRRFSMNYMQDDFAAMNSVISRRFSPQSLKSSDKSFEKMPDLILVDGGFGQVKAAKKGLNELGINIPVFGMVKDRKHRTRALATENKEIEIKNNGRLFLFITSVQDEVHRYTVNYHRKLREKGVKTSQLDKIKGVGKVRSKELLKAFGSVQKIFEASSEELASVKSITEPCAKEIYNYFHGNDVKK